MLAQNQEVVIEVRLVGGKVKHGHAEGGLNDFHGAVRAIVVGRQFAAVFFHNF